VALKQFDVRGAPDLKTLELFEREADVLRALRHHGVPEVHDRVRDTWEGAPAEFLVMEYVARYALRPANVTHRGRTEDFDALVDAVRAIATEAATERGRRRPRLARAPGRSTA
jgi:serine/threonine protein kinase